MAAVLVHRKSTPRFSVNVCPVLPGRRVNKRVRKWFFLECFGFRFPFFHSTDLFGIAYPERHISFQETEDCLVIVILRVTVIDRRICITARKNFIHKLHGWHNSRFGCCPVSLLQCLIQWLPVTETRKDLICHQLRIHLCSWSLNRIVSFFL